MLGEAGGQVCLGMLNRSLSQPFDNKIYLFSQTPCLPILLASLPSLL